MALVEDRPPADVSGRVPLHYAALFGDLHRAQELVDAGPTIGAIDHDGQTPLHYAAQGCSVAVAELLLSKGVDGRRRRTSTATRRCGARRSAPAARARSCSCCSPTARIRTTRTVTAASPVKLAKALGGVDMSLRSA